MALPTDGSSESERRRVAIELILLDLERLERQAAANGLELLAYIIDMAIAEAREEMRDI